MNKPILFSGIQPSGELTIGNYIGVLKNWKYMQDNYNCLYCIADMHSITVYKKSNDLFKSILDTIAIYLACDIDPYKSSIFIQSHISEHAKLNWILNCFSNFNNLKKMNQFKNNLLIKKNINVGIFNYPTLMAADILLYNTNVVTVGKDQKQHIEYVRNLANNFNKLYGNIFTIPEIHFSNFSSKIMSLIDVNKKMSKSDKNKNNIITLLEDPNKAVEKIKFSITDSDNPPVIKYDEINKKGISNLLNILSALTEKSIYDLENELKGYKYKDFKNIVSNFMYNFLIKLQKKYYKIRNDERYLSYIIKLGAEKIKNKANLMINKIYKAIGFLLKT